jgi:hypothetical protein
MAGMAAAGKLVLLTWIIKLGGGAHTLIHRLCEVGLGPSRWATAVLQISNIFGCGHCSQNRGHCSQNLGRRCPTVKSHVFAAVLGWMF